MSNVLGEKIPELGCWATQCSNNHGGWKGEARRPAEVVGLQGDLQRGRMVPGGGEFYMWGGEFLSQCCILQAASEVWWNFQLTVWLSPGLGLGNIVKYQFQCGTNSNTSITLTGNVKQTNVYYNSVRNQIHLCVIRLYEYLVNSWPPDLSYYQHVMQILSSRWHCMCRLSPDSKQQISTL